MIKIRNHVILPVGCRIFDCFAAAELENGNTEQNHETD